jgi:putative nucleotidyltransferase with HDIG domain
MDAMKFQNYWDNRLSLENRLDWQFDILLNIPKQTQKEILSFLEPLKMKGNVGLFHYEHSIRVGILASRIAGYMHLDAKATLYAGLLHDVGKALVPVSTLGRTETWSKEDQDNIEPHVHDSYRLLRDKFDFSAEIVGLHHRFQKNCYPTEPFPHLHEYSKGTDVMIAFYGRILALADQFDAMHRVNSKGRLTGKEIKEKLIEFNLDLKILINNLYDDEILIEIP